MRATTDHLTALLQMQQVDLELIKAKKALDELPQRSVILAARQKKRAVEEKREKVQAMRQRVEDKASKLETEDATLAQKQRAVQGVIDEARGDYRSVEAHAKELNGFAKRRNTLEEELAVFGEELAKIDEVGTQVSVAYARLEQQEKAAIESFQKQGGALQSNIARLTAQKQALSGELTAEIMDAYQQVSARTGGVAVARLVEDRCGACRNIIEGGRFIALKAQAPLGTCPHCKRLLVVL